MLTSSGGSLNADRGGVKFAKILLTSYVNAPLLQLFYCYRFKIASFPTHFVPRSH